jgi:hypothetical protein
MNKMKVAYNVWRSLKGYQDSGYDVKWTQRNKDQFEIVCHVLTWRDKFEKGELQELQLEVE